MENVMENIQNQISADQIIPEIKNASLSNNYKQKINFKELNEKGERIYNVTKIINHLSEREGKGFVRDLCNIISEERRDLLGLCYPIIGKDHLLILIEKSLKIQNEGGVERHFPKINNNSTEANIKNTKTTGGILFKLIKTEAGLNKQEIKDIFKKDYSKNNQRRKVIKKLEKLILK